MFNRRKFLTGLLAGPAAALADDAPPACTGGQKVWVIVGVNWVYNDEFNYSEGDYLTEHAFADKAAADRTCAELIQDFCAAEDPDEFVMPDFALPDDWEDCSRQQQWHWLLGRGPEPSDRSDSVDDGYACVTLPFEVREMQVPASAAHQIQVTGSRP